MPAKREPPAEAGAPVVEPGSARYFAWLYAGERREFARTLFELEHEVEASLRPGLEHQVAHVRLAWWGEECERLARGVPAHPATRRLRELTGADAARIELRGLIEATAWDLAAATPETRDELERQCERWANAMIVPWVTGSAATGSAVIDGARALGIALREIELLLCLAPHARRGWMRMPLDELDALGAEPRSLAEPPWPPALSGHVRQRLDTLRRSLEGSLVSLGQPALHAWSAVASAAARRAMRALPGACRARRLDGVADALHAWRAARAALRSTVRMP
jgi:phytoene/squalene synthetase